MRNQKIVRLIYPDAQCVPNQGIVLKPEKVAYAIFRVNDGVPISNEWHRTRKEAWREAANQINKRMLRKLEL